MARDQEPMTEAEIEAAREGLEELREQVREDLAEALGGDPENYNADNYPAGETDEPVTDGGE